MLIYKTINLINNKWYIGKDAANRNYYLGSGTAIRAAVKKYGKSNFQKIILEECENLSQLSDREKHWISITNAVNDSMSYNIAPGGEGGDLSKYTDYSKIDYSNHKMKGATKWFSNLSKEEQKEFHTKQANKRSKIWYVSKIDDPTEMCVKNINQWCKENRIDSSYPSTLTNPNHTAFQSQHKGWRFRKEGQDILPVYKKVKRGAPFGTPNRHKGKTWKIVDGKRTWIFKESK
jgi:GIY-YIG catalytic domain